MPIGHRITFGWEARGLVVPTEEEIVVELAGLIKDGYPLDPLALAGRCGVTVEGFQELVGAAREYIQRQVQKENDANRPFRRVIDTLDRAELDDAVQQLSSVYERLAARGTDFQDTDFRLRGLLSEYKKIRREGAPVVVPSAGELDPVGRPRLSRGPASPRPRVEGRRGEHPG